MSLSDVLIILGLVFLGLDTIGIGNTRIKFQSAGLFCWLLAGLVGGVHLFN